MPELCLSNVVKRVAFNFKINFREPDFIDQILRLPVDFRTADDERFGCVAYSFKSCFNGADNRAARSFEVFLPRDDNVESTRQRTSN